MADKNEASTDAEKADFGERKAYKTQGHKGGALEENQLVFFLVAFSCESKVTLAGKHVYEACAIGEKSRENKDQNRWQQDEGEGCENGVQHEPLGDGVVNGGNKTANNRGAHSEK